jgi:hypothetical protein
MALVTGSLKHPIDVHAGVDYFVYYVKLYLPHGSS